MFSRVGRNFDPLRSVDSHFYSRLSFKSLQNRRFSVMLTMLQKHRPLFWFGLGALILLIIIATVIILNLPKPQYVSDSNFDLVSFEDGVYEGECENGLVFAKVEVEIQNHSIAGVKILEHRYGKGKPAEKIINDVVNNQSVEADAVSGATMSSQTILKAIENALTI